MIETNFIDTEIGCVPADWKVVSLGEIGRFSKGKGISRTESNTGMIPAIRYGEIYTTHNDYIKSFTSHISEEIAKSSRKLTYGDILFTASGETKEDIGKAVAFAINDCEAYAGGDIIIFSSSIDIDPIFFGFLLNTKIVVEQRASKAQGDAVVHITTDSIKSLKLPLPPLPEQRRIASALSSIDNLISALDKLIEKKCAIKTGTMQELLGGKRRVKECEGEWKSVTIEELFDFGNGYTPSKAISDFWINGTIPWFRMEDIRSNGRILSDSIQHITPEAVKGSGLFPANSIILSTTATIGEHALITVDSLANQQFTFLMRKVKRENDIDMMFFFHYCFILGDWCRANINDGGLMAVNISDLKAHQIYIPSDISEQRAIASVLTAMDDELAALEAKKAKYVALKQGMMQQLLTGKIRLIDCSAK